LHEGSNVGFDPGDPTTKPRGPLLVSCCLLFLDSLTPSKSQTNWKAKADINGDGIVDIYDAIIMLGNFNQ
jgi:hypothetical protein